MRTSFKYILVFMLSVLMGCVSSGGEMIPSSLPTLVNGNASQGNDPTDPSTNNQQTDPTDPADPNQGNQQTDPVDPNGGNTDPANDPGNQNQGNDPATDPTDPNQGSNDPTDPNSGNQQTDPTDPVDPNQGNGGSNDPVTPVINVVDYESSYATDPAVTKVILDSSATGALIEQFIGSNATAEYKTRFKAALHENDNGEYVYFKATRPTDLSPLNSNTDENGNEIRYTNLNVYGGNSVDLSYTDFGYWKSVTEKRNSNGDLVDEKVNSIQMKYIMPITTDNTSYAMPTNPLSFTGKAYAAIKDGDEYANKIISGNASLIIDPRSNYNPELSVNFDNWYNMTVTKAPNTDALTYDFTFTKGANYQDNGYDFEGTKRGYFHNQYRGNNQIRETAGEFDVLSPNASNLELNGVFGAKRTDPLPGEVY